jgi:methylphosphotriester-DNA--protein-cysteine methyltransferase
VIKLGKWCKKEIGLGPKETIERIRVAESIKAGIGKETYEEFPAASKYFNKRTYIDNFRKYMKIHPKKYFYESKMTKFFHEIIEESKRKLLYLNEIRR